MKQAQKDHEDFLVNDGRLPGNGVTLDDLVDEKPSRNRNNKIENSHGRHRSLNS